LHADTLSSLGRASEAEPLMKEALDTIRRVYGPDHEDTLSALNKYAIMLAKNGQRDESVMSGIKKIRN